MAEQALNPLFLKFAQLAEKDGTPPLNTLPGAWERKIDDHWYIAVNGLKHPVTVEPEGTMGVTDLKPYNAAVWFNGWLAGLMDPYGGSLAAGELANQEALEKAIEDALTM